MKGLGVAAIVATVISFILWLASWVFWTFQQFSLMDSTNYEAQRSVRNIFQGIGFLSSLTQYAAIILIALAVISAANRLQKSSDFAGKTAR